MNDLIYIPRNLWSEQAVFNSWCQNNCVDVFSFEFKYTMLVAEFKNSNDRREFLIFLKKKYGFVE